MIRSGKEPKRNMHTLNHLSHQVLKFENVGYSDQVCGQVLI